jgi:N-acetylneuraminic acid mutarotase
MGEFMKIVASSLAVSFLLSSVAQAADVRALAPGKPAGVRHAQEVGLGDNTLLYVGLGAAAIAGIAIAASSGNDNTPAKAPTTTTTTGTTG